MVQLVNYKPKRLFAFGCSFTKYFWSTWPEIVADSLDIDFYNYGRSGAGNQYISNMLMQAYKQHNITKDDLVLISWTNVCREDRWVKGDWVVTGNIFSQGIYDQSFMDKFVDPVGYYVKDLATISFVKEFLDKIGCQYHFMSMCDILEKQDQGKDYNLIEEKYKPKYDYLINLYKDVTDTILPSFYEILWRNDIHQYKFDLDKKNISPFFLDGHPSPIEHFNYVKSIFDHDWSAVTETKVQIAQENYIEIIKNLTTEYKKHFAIYDQPMSVLQNLKDKTLVKLSLPVKHI